MKKQPSISDIAEYVYEAGCDDVGTFGCKFEGGIQAQQIPDEIAPCIHAILGSGENIKNYMEIGVAGGGTTRIFNKFFAPQKIVLLDDNRHPKAHVRPYILDGIDREEIIGISQSQGSYEAVRGLGLLFDIIFVDGDHTYLGVNQDVKMYRDFLRPGGFLILHDTALEEWGPIRVMAELKRDKGMKFINEWKTEKPMRPLGVALFQKEKGGEDAGK